MAQGSTSHRAADPRNAPRGRAQDSRSLPVAMADDDRSGFERGSFTHAGTTHELLRGGSAPAVIVIAEMPGITPKVLAFARMVAAIGCSAVLPVLFGEPGRDPGGCARRRGHVDSRRAR